MWLFHLSDEQRCRPPAKTFPLRVSTHWRVLAKRRNTAEDRFTARPKGLTQLIHYGHAVLEKDPPFPADCALS